MFQNEISSKIRPTRFSSFDKCIFYMGSTTMQHKYCISLAINQPKQKGQLTRVFGVRPM